MCGWVLFLQFCANLLVFAFTLYVCLGIVSLCVFTVFRGLFLYFCANFSVFTVYMCLGFVSLCPNFSVFLLGLRVFLGLFLCFCANFFVFVFTVYVFGGWVFMSKFLCDFIGFTCVLGCFFISVLICVCFLLLLVLSVWFLSSSFFFFFLSPHWVWRCFILVCFYVCVVCFLCICFYYLYMFWGVTSFLFLTGCWKRISQFVFMLISFVSWDCFSYVYMRLLWSLLCINALSPYMPLIQYLFATFDD